MGIQNNAKKNGFLVRNLRNFFEHRALWMYLLCDEFKKKGIDPEAAARAAIRRCGLYHGRRALTGLQNVSEQAASQAASRAADTHEGNGYGNCCILQKKLFPPAGKGIFEMEFLKITEEAFDVDFHYCPLVSAWQKQGCSDAEIDKLCDWAMEGDRGIAEAFGCELDLPKTIAKGDGVCQIRIRRKQ